MTYCDTSLLVSALANEPRGERVRLWLDQQNGDLVISAWVHAELAAAIAGKRRLSALSSQEAAAIMAQWAVARATFVELPIEAWTFAHAADLALTPDISLRAGDALHLALAHREGIAMASLDAGLRRACSIVGVAAIDPLA